MNVCVEYATILVWGAIVANPETRILVKVVYFKRIGKHQKRMVK